MRRWLIQKKQNIAQKISSKEIDDEAVKTKKEQDHLEKIVAHIKSKAKFLVAL